MLPLDRQNALRDRVRVERPGWLPASERYAALVRSQLAPDSRLLDLGCGRGGVVEQLSHPLPETLGFDPDLLSLQQHRLPTLPRAAALSDALPLPNASIDVALASWVLEHLARPGATLREVARVLRPGGALLFITPNRQHPLIQINRLVGRLTLLQEALVAAAYGRAAVDTFPTYYRANTSRALRALGAQTGLALERLEAIPDPTYWAALPAGYPLFCAIDNRLPASWALHLVGCYRSIGGLGS